MKMTLPEESKPDSPRPTTPFSKVLGATPVVMTVLATVLAGLSSSEMTSAQYDRSMAAQLQSKAGDQWNLFQAKRLRGTFQRTTLDLLNNTAELHSFEGEALRAAVDASALPSAEAKALKWKADILAVLASAEGQGAVALLQKGQLPAFEKGPAMDPTVKEGIEAIQRSRPENEITQILARITPTMLEKELSAARDRVQAFDQALAPSEQTVDRLGVLLTEKPLARASPGGASIDSLGRDYTASRLRYTALRYDADARLNQGIATLLELQVRKSNLSAERHHLRSQRFFYGMLAAQMGVVVASLANAARQRNLLWSIAAAAGTGALVFATYVYLAI